MDRPAHATDGANGSATKAAKQRNGSTKGVKQTIQRHYADTTDNRRNLCYSRVQALIPEGGRIAQISRETRLHYTKGQYVQ